MQSLRRQIDYWFWPAFLLSVLIFVNASGFPFKWLRYHGFPFTFAVRTGSEIRSSSSVALIVDIVIAGGIFLLAWKLSAWRFRRVGSIAPNFTNDQGPRTTD